MYVDGSLAARQIIHSGSNEVKGFKDSYMRCARRSENTAVLRSHKRVVLRCRTLSAALQRVFSDAEYKEFVFTLPRRVRSTENAEPDFNDEERQALKKQLESIRVEIFEAKFQSSETRVMGASRRARCSAPAVLRTVHCCTEPHARALTRRFRARPKATSPTTRAWTR